jgi:hypothetical protein
MILLTRDRIEAIRTTRGGFVLKSLRSIGVKFGGRKPLPWIREMENTEITEQQWAKAVWHKNRFEYKRSRKQGVELVPNK